MKKILSSILLIAGGCILAASCSNGVYSANPNGTSNTSVNPLKPLTIDEFTWSNGSPLAANINGAAFSADTVAWYLDSTGTNVFSGESGGKGFVFYFSNVYATNLYNLSFNVVSTQAVYYTSADTATKTLGDKYLSTLGNSGQVLITQNDSAYLKGMFYFQGVSVDGNVVNISNGVFNITKPVLP